MFFFIDHVFITLSTFLLLLFDIQLIESAFCFIVGLFDVIFQQWFRSHQQLICIFRGFNPKLNSLQKMYCNNIFKVLKNDSNSKTHSDD